MDVSFTGINNIRIFEKSYSKLGSYLSYDSMVKQGNKKYKDIIIRCDLSDDNLGKDLTDFKETLAKSRMCYQVNCINPGNPNHIDLYCKSQIATEDLAKTEHSSFQINNYEIMLDERQALPLFSFMAHLTRKISNMADLSDKQRSVADFVNKLIDKEAIEYIDNMY